MLTLLVILLVFFLLFGGYGYGRGWGYYGWSPAGILLILLILAILLRW